MSTSQESTVITKLDQLQASTHNQQAILTDLHTTLHTLIHTLDTKPLEPAAGYALTRLRRQVVRERLGGVDSLTYRQRPDLVRAAYKAARLDFLTHFALAHYQQLPQKHYKAATQFWNDWQLPQALAGDVYKANHPDQPHLVAVA